MLLSGSAPLPADVVAQFTSATGIEVHQGYGLTEAAPVVTSTLGQPLRPRSVGRPLTGIEVRLVDERIKHWMGEGAVATDRVAKFLGKADLAPMPVFPEQPKQSLPKKKAQERAAAGAAAAAAPAEGAAPAAAS